MQTTETGHMRRALALAERGWGRVSPNPLVGAVVVAPSGEVVGEGWHEGPGTPHAEVGALHDAGAAARGATVFATLEPCNHFGRTPPCTKALIDAGVSRVVAAVADPNLGAGEPGVAELRAAGIEATTGVLAPEARRLNEAFLTHVETGRPFVTLKLASTLDGKTAASDGSSRWITGEGARADVQRLRAGADAILVGAGTALADDPRLTVRDDAWTSAKPPLRIVVDAAGRVPAHGRLFDGEAPTLVATSAAAPEERVSEWSSTGAEVAVLEVDTSGRVSLPALVEHLGKLDVQSVLIEGGPTLAGSAIESGIVDRLTLYLAPLLVGGVDAPGILGGPGLAPIDAARRVEIVRIERFGPDLRVEADVHGNR